MNPATELTLHVPPDAVTWAYRRASGEVVVYVVQGGKTGEYRRVEVTPEPAHAADCAVAMGARHECSCGAET